jgi:hypothetical protein
VTVQTIEYHRCSLWITQRIFSGFVNKIESLASRIGRQNQLINELQGKVANLEMSVELKDFGY